MSTVTSTSQMTLDFEPGLTEKHPHLLDCIRTAAHSHRNPLKTIAADMDLSLSEFGRKLKDNPNDPRNFSVEDLENFITATGDMTPIYWLIEKYLEADKAKRDRALEELARQLPNVLALIAAATKAAT